MEKNNITINISELRAVVDSIFAYIEDDRQVKDVELSEDYYWNIADEVVYMGERIEGEITVGSLYADLDFLRPILKNKEQAFPLMLIHVAPLLRFLALKVA